MQMLNRLTIDLEALGYVKTDRENWVFYNFTPPFNKLYFVLEGELCITQKNDKGKKIRTHCLSAGNVYMIPAHHTYDFYTESQFRKCFIHFNIPMVDGKDLFCLNQDILSRSFDPLVIEQLEEGFRNNDLEVLFKFKQILYDTIYNMMSQQPEILLERKDMINRYSKVTLEILKYIDTHLDARLKINDIAQEFLISPQILSSQFKEEVGMGLKKYISNKLIIESEKLLLNTSLSIKEISYQLRFSDQYNFSKFFKTATELSPMEYRKMSIRY